MNGYYRHKESVDAPPPLTEAEQLLQDIKLSEVSDQLPQLYLPAISAILLQLLRNDRHDCFMNWSWLNLYSFFFQQTMRNAGTTTRTTHLQGINFPFQQDAVDALTSLAQKKITYVKLVSCCDII